MKRIVIVAGDKSADRYGGLLCEKLKEKIPDLEIFSFAGEQIAQHSQQVINLLSYSVTGIFEVLTSLGKIFAVFKKTAGEIKALKPDLVILCDFPDFNLRLACALNKKYPIFYYISPQVWAWRAKRVKLIKEFVDRMVVIFKFEESFYRQRGVDALYFGHPLLELIEKKDIATKKIISLLPGSRRSEVKSHLPLMIAAKRIIEQRASGYSFRIIRPENIPEEFYRPAAEGIEIIPHSYQAIAESEFIITSSGTATVEIAYIGVPFLILYKVNRLTWEIVKRKLNKDSAPTSIGMANILAGKRVIDEFLQDDVRPEKIAECALSYLNDEKRYAALKGELAKIAATLEPRGATERFAGFIADYLR